MDPRGRTGRDGTNGCHRGSKSHVAHPANMKRADDANEKDSGDVPQNGSPQCRICFDGPDQELGRLIRPCLCKGSISVGPRADRHNCKLHIPTPFLP